MMQPRLVRFLQLAETILCIILILGLFFCSSESAEVGEDGFLYNAFRGCRRHVADLTQFGGVGDGKTLNTGAFQNAVDHLARYSNHGGSILVVPPGRWLTGSFNLTASHFTLYIHKDVVILASQVESHYPIVEPLPSYGRGREAPGPRFSALIFGTNLTDIVITGSNGTIDGQGQTWWDKFRNKELNNTRPHLIEIMHSTNVLVSNITLLNSPFWTLHPVYSRTILIQNLTILAPTHVPNTDGIDPDSCSDVRIEDCYIVSGDDCIAVKSGFDQYGIRFGMPSKHVVIKRLTCKSPKSAAIALGSEMSGGIRDVRAQDITLVETESCVRVKSAPGRGGYVKDIYVSNATMHTMKYVFWLTTDYKDHADDGYDPMALPDIRNVNYRNMVAENVTTTAKLVGLAADPSRFCISNVTVSLTADPDDPQWNCSNVNGVWSRVTPQPCPLLHENDDRGFGCPFPSDALPIEHVSLNTCVAGVKTRTG